MVHTYVECISVQKEARVRVRERVVRICVFSSGR